MKLQLALIDLIVAYILCCTLVKASNDLAGPLGLALLIVTVIYNVKQIQAMRNLKKYEAAYKAQAGIRSGAGGTGR